METRVSYRLITDSIFKFLLHCIVDKESNLENHLEYFHGLFIIYLHANPLDAIFVSELLSSQNYYISKDRYFRIII